MPAQSFSGEQRCACKASSGDESGEDTPPWDRVSMTFAKQYVFTNLILTPGSSSTSRGLLSILLHSTIIMSISTINGRVVGLCHKGRSVHLVRWGRHDGR
jgi:hypothetical protein